MAAEACQMLVFRDGKQTLSGRRLLTDLIAELRALSFATGHTRNELLISCLLRAGELECAAADLDPFSSETFGLCTVTDLLASALLRPEKTPVLALQTERMAVSLRPQPSVEVSAPEGFCYYGLHPLDYADVLQQAAASSAPVTVIGIRGIGTTLSAVVAAAFREGRSPQQLRTAPVERFTVRPTGHPYDRVAELSVRAQGQVRAQSKRGANFLVVDEGPGMSGSSFLAVGEALERAGAVAGQITFIGSRQVDPAALVALNAQQRWRRFHFLCVQSQQRLPKHADLPVYGGDWRDRFDGAAGLERSSGWWPLSAPKYVSGDGRMLFKFCGHGRYGKRVLARAALAAEAGFAPAVEDSGLGFHGYVMQRGRLLSATDANQQILDRIAAYLAFRAATMRAAAVDTQALEAMARFNVSQLAGGELPGDFSLAVERPVVADARMMPHEWMRSGDHILKLDHAQHGDDHFFPGPTDIAWDLAGAIVEWRLSAAAAQALIERYAALAEDEVQPRLENYLLAYAAFRAGFCTMARSAMQHLPAEAALLQRDAKRYGEQLSVLRSRRAVA